MTVAVEDMRAMSDEQLQELYAAGETAALTVAAQRDQADANAARIAPAQQALEAIREEWREAARADYAAAGASMICKGTMFSPEGLANGPADEFSLWTVRDSDAHRWASRELNEWWDLHGRLTIGEYQRRRALANRLAREDTATEEAGNGGRVDTDRRAGLADDDAPGLRRGDAASSVRSGRHEAVTEAGTEDSDTTGSVQPGRQRIGGEAMDTDPIVAGAGDANARQNVAPRREVTGQVVRRPTSQAARRPVDAIPGDQLLDLLRQWIGTYARLPSPAALDLVTLWAAHCHVRDEEGKRLLFRATPRLWLLSNSPGSGKSRVLELLNLVCPEAYGLSMETTAPGLVKSMKNGETFFIDEADILFNTGKRHSAVRAILNGGYTRNGTYPTAKGREPVFGPVASAGLDVLEKDTGDTMTALLSRGFKIRMRKSSKDDRPAKITRRTEAEGAKLNEWLGAWAAQIRDGVPDAEPVMPPELDGRAEQISEPLVIVGDAAWADTVARAERDGTPPPEDGGWAERSRAACVEIALAQDAVPIEDDESTAEAFAAFATDLTGSLAGAAPEDTEDSNDDWEE